MRSEERLMSFRSLKNLLLGRPLQSFEIKHERLPKWKALAVFSSDALSSVAYATQEILIPLSLVSIAATYWSVPISLGILALLAIVGSSYWQTIRSYPSGGGAYSVVKDNLGVGPGLVVGAALLVDYVLTVAVSVAAGVEALGSAFPFVFEHRLFFGAAFVAIVSIINLRGIRESGTIFSLPTYVFIFSMLCLLLVGGYRVLDGELQRVEPLMNEAFPEISLFLLLKAFSSGCAALTGVEAISNGIPSFREPTSRNAQITLAWMVIILGTFFFGITALTHILGILPGADHETLISKLAREVFGGGFFYLLVQFSTALILFLAANTSYADFPRVCSLLAKDRFIPRQFASLGDRLVFSNGILLLGILSIFLLHVFDGKSHNLIPLYAVGVFLSFTLSQAGMVRHHWVIREKNWQMSLVVNALGALTTLVVLMVITATKFASGAWIVVMVFPVLVLWFRMSHSHYKSVEGQLQIQEGPNLFTAQRKHTVVIPISGIHSGVVDAIRYAKSISNDVRAIYVELDEAGTQRLRETWKRLKPGIELVVLPSTYRSLITPLIEYVRNVEQERTDDMVTIVIPEFVTAHWWERIYHNQSAFLIRAALAFERGKVVTSVRYHLK